MLADFAYVRQQIRRLAAPHMLPLQALFQRVPDCLGQRLPGQGGRFPGQAIRNRILKAECHGASSRLDLPQVDRRRLGQNPMIQLPLEDRAARPDLPG
jgi:hypothetical protein